MKYVAVVTPAISDPRSEGAAFRLWQILGIFSELGYKVYLAPLQTDFKSLSISESENRIHYWESTGFKVLRNGISEIPERIEVQKNNGIFWYDGYVAAGLALREQKNVYPSVFHLFDTVDLGYRRYFREAKLRNNPKLLQKAIQVKRIEFEAATMADLTLAISEEEREILGKEAPSARMLTLPNIHLCQRETPGFEERDGVVFVGSYFHPPNRDAVEWLIKEIWPQCLTLDPGLKLYLVGAGPIDDLLDRSDDTVIRTGYIDSLEDFFAKRKLSVAPLRFGAGIKGKVLLSLGLGVPVVGTSIAAEGISQGIPPGICQAQSAAEIARRICELHRDIGDWTQLRESGLNLIEEEFSRARAKQRIDELIGLIADISNHKT